MLTTSLTFLVLVLRTIDSHRCLTTLEEVNPKRLMMMNGEAVNVRLEVSQRITHRLTSHITKIFLEEVVGYAGVTLVRKDDHEYLRSDKIYKRLSDSLANGSGAIVPETMVNMEVWIPPQEDTLPLLNKYNVKECGSIGPPGRLSWFIPRTLAKSKDISWLTFGDREASKCFDVQEDEQWVMWRIRNATYDRDTGGHYCDNLGCKDGMYVPERCREGSCALLLAAYPSSTGFVKDDIDTLKLYVKVAWVGPHLKDLTDFLTERYNRKKDSGISNKSLVILHWTPSALVSDQRDFVAVNFPRCGSLDSNVGCAYESHRLTKVVWGRLETAAKFAFQTITRVKFTREMYRQLLRRYNEVAKNSSDEQVSCSWLRENLDYALSNWKLNYSDKKKLYVGGIFPMSGSAYTAKSIAIAAKLAKEAINANNSLLRDYNLNLLASDGQCKSDMVMKSFIDYIFNNYYENLVGVLGPACSETVEPLIGVSKHYRTVVISYSAEGSSFNDRSRYPYFFRTIGENKEYRNVYLALLQRLGWRRIASLTEDGQKYTEYISYMEEVLRDNGIAFVANAKFPKERDAEAITKSLQDLKRKRAKIIIADVDDRVARQVMCEAYRLGMTAVEGYVWFLPLWLRARWYDTDRYNEIQGEQVVCSTADMSKAINGHLALSHAYFAADDEVMQEGITVRQWRDRYEKECRKQKEEPSNYAAYAYDAMWTYAYAIERLIRENHSYLLDLHSPRTVQRFTEIISASDFAGLSGRIKFYGGPSRYSIVNIVQHVDNETRIVGNFYPDALVEDAAEEEKGRVKGGRLRLNVSALVWLSGAQPDDGSESPTTNCPLGYFAQLLEVSCEVAIVIVNVIGFALLGILLVLAFVAVKRRYDEKVRMHHKYMISLGLDLGQLDTATLDKWEIPRNRVVINRKIGEGAFGTVYGGEAFFPENGWVAVAVKTLKVGSSIDEKSDFLSEFEVMKRFEHKNIIRLLGVCLKCEPVLTVMEFMLYGDLKTYLLARRHLVNDRKYEDSDEISNKKLTAMALDVARALSYLAQLKYVHRDVASRNCLVNAQRVVKLGDFGMTRPMYENDYYRFNRKGMLPVRWMAPESLALGVFSAASDVWSYGVLLYEIVTFGSFPFQGMSNNEVLVHVKAGNCLVVPKGVKAPLENLMYSCWCVKQNGRPTAPEIVEFLATNPRILSPCLDVPLASVQLEHTGQMEMHLNEHVRKFSSEWPKEALPSHYQHHLVAATPLLQEDASSMEEGYTARRREQTFHKYVNVRADYAITNSSYNADVADAEDVQTEERTSMIAKTNDDEAFSDLG